MLARIAKFQTATFHALHRGDRGATAVEYGLMVGLIAAVIITVVGLLGTRIAALFQEVLTALH